MTTCRRRTGGAAAVRANENTPTPVAGAGALENVPESTPDDTAHLQVHQLEAALLRGLLAYPAARVLEVADTLAQQDFPDDAHRRVMYAVYACAQALDAAGESDRAVSPEAVQVMLQGTGDLAHGVTSSVLLEVTTGNPPAWHDVQLLAAALRTHRLRRAVSDYGHSLVAAAGGSTPELTGVLQQLSRLIPLAQRAGLEVA